MPGTYSSSSPGDPALPQRFRSTNDSISCIERLSDLNLTLAVLLLSSGREGLAAAAFCQQLIVSPSRIVLELVHLAWPHLIEVVRFAKRALVWSDEYVFRRQIQKPILTIWREHRAAAFPFRSENLSSADVSNDFCGGDCHCRTLRAGTRQSQRNHQHLPASFATGPGD